MGYFYLFWIALDVIRGRSGGEDGIRTHVPSYPDQLISSQRRYNRFGTSPLIVNDLSFITLFLTERTKV